MKEVLAIVGGVIVGLSTIPYIRDILRGKTKPNIVTWSTWTILGAVTTAATFAAHEPRTAFLSLGLALCNLGVLALGLRYGVAKMSIFDILCWIGVAIGLLLWWILKSPTAGVVVPVVIDFVAMVPTLRHAWKSPYEETWQSFAIAVPASICTLLSLKEFNFVAWLFPVYLGLCNLTITLTILYSRRIKTL